MKGPLATFQLQRQEDGSLALSVLEAAGVARETGGFMPRQMAVQALRAALAPPPPQGVPLERYHEDFGPVLWWRFPVDEPPFVGRPDDSDWPGYHTHFTFLPPTPEQPQPEAPACAS